MIAKLTEWAGLGGNKETDVGASKEEDASSYKVVEVVPQTRKKCAKRREYYTESEGSASEEVIYRASKARVKSEREKGGSSHLRATITNMHH